ncbi:Crp/Fnr family transcriptional regulator [Aliarcobacter cryaerophilus]|jgi:CRP/FNR family transcriptional regulator|uniref:Crp/Fnr family transcriptional regulator n=1 Tax=Aliarcobacter cryaerophilus TaxID=28198 RepID=UPI0009C5C6E7|nr:Crp/Fnr family transcriptional regulator [Aliarcobacter cryaerophilus]OQA74900.1 MAG: DNA-binding transcriptional dual regulator Crp [Candidatus Dependentiae bacterium ADurb.Bin246]MCT7432811.1 Crp/Fnr family transcriptional regulator [Aliarcobacter cryaerophilus]MCT7463639.1 Crp/Fnr family transcriptional regulator [Aliarcobacter cryaerophilus]MCT7467418.1 Crp/Fnr family transcriptional regulator [Aliarcobacter cryaerophilus]MCT7508597.1 Crp/Fnr family transcriptional regulator [Aliarcobac
MTLSQSIRSLDFFENLSDEQIDVLSNFSFISKYEKDSILFYETDLKTNLLFLVSGLIKIYKYDKFDNEIFLYHIYSNSLISELSNLNTNEIFCFSNASFIEDSVVLSIDFLKLQEHFLNNNLLVKELMNSLLKKTNQLQSLVNRELVFDATAKVAYMLVSDLNMFNKLKRQDVSFMLHIQPETLSRVLKKLSRDNIIEIENQQVIIKDEIALNSIFKGVAI